MAKKNDKQDKNAPENKPPDQVKDADNTEQEFTVTLEQAQQLKERMEKLQAERDEYLQTAQRLQAEFDNFRKRNATLRADSLKEGARDTIKELLIICDSLERAVDAAKEDTSPLAEGVIILQKQLCDVFTRLGIEVIDPIDQPFDPNVADAVMRQEQEGTAPNTVIMVMQKGYSLESKLIRPAMVKVSG